MKSRTQSTMITSTNDEKNRRKQMVIDAYQHGHELSLANDRYRGRVESYLETLLLNDHGSGDRTSEFVVDKDQHARAIISAQEEGIVAGVEELIYFYESHGVRAKRAPVVDSRADGTCEEYRKDGERRENMIKDGGRVYDGTSIIELEGNARTILGLERVGLNLIRRLSGIATLTARYNYLLESEEGAAQVAATRKVCIDEYLEKKAVYVGGGLTHRMGLDSHIMIKDCHLDLIRAEGNEGSENPVYTAIKRAYTTEHNIAHNVAGHNLPVEVEVASTEEAIEAAQAFYRFKPEKGIAIIMLDNMSPPLIVKTLDELKSRGLYNEIIYEASGGINLTTALLYASAGVDVISTSEITEGALRLNIHQEIVEISKQTGGA